MISRSIAVASALVVAACSKSEPGTFTTTSAPASASPVGTVATGAPNPTPAPPVVAPADGEHAGHAGHTPGMPSGMPMQGHPHDGGMGQPMPPNVPNMPGHR